MDALTSKEVIEIYQLNKITNRIWKIIEINQINDTEVTEILDWIITGIDKKKIMKTLQFIYKVFNYTLKGIYLMSIYILYHMNPYLRRKIPSYTEFQYTFIF